MSLVVRIDAPRWRGHVREVVDQHPGIVPVAKGNGYGFSNPYLAQVAQDLGLDLLAVGCHEEVDQVAEFRGDKLVLLPWHPKTATRPCGTEIHTIAHSEALAALDADGAPSRIVLKLATSMDRFGFDLAEATGALPQGVDIVGLSVHAPPGASAVRETYAALMRAEGAGLPMERIFVSHLTPQEENALSERFDAVVRSRIGTRLWLGSDATEVRSQLLDVHRARHPEVGYHQVKSGGRMIAIVAGGTSHGIGLDAPRIVHGLRPQLREAGKKAQSLMGKMLSPFSLRGQRLEFVEPPHAQISMLWLPDELADIEIGDELAARVRYTTLWPDACVEVDGEQVTRIPWGQAAPVSGTRPAPKAAAGTNAPVRKAAAKKAPAKKAAVKKAAVKKAAAKKAAAKKTSANTTATKKAAATRAAAGTPATKKAAASKTAAKRTASKTTATRTATAK